MKMSDAGRQALTETFEGDVLSVYPDPATGGAPWTAGYGHTGDDVQPGMVVTQEMADAWLAGDLARAEGQVNGCVNVNVTQHEFDALVDFFYNLGDRDHSTLILKLNSGDLEGAALEFDKWDLAAGKVMAGLLRRRQAETNWFNTQD
jgi:lysozyme